MSSFQFSLLFPSERGEFRIYWQARALAVLNLSEMRPQSVIQPAMKLILSGFQKPRLMDLAQGVSRRLQPVRKDTCGLRFNGDNTSVGGGGGTHRHESNSETKQIFSPEDTPAHSSASSPQRNIDVCQTEGQRASGDVSES